jgi:hypothetical protein
MKINIFQNNNISFLFDHHRDETKIAIHSLLFPNRCTFSSIWLKLSANFLGIFHTIHSQKNYNFLKIKCIFLFFCNYLLFYRYRNHSIQILPSDELLITSKNKILFDNFILFTISHNYELDEFDKLFYE